MSAHLKSQLAEGDDVIRRLSKIAIAARPGSKPSREPARPPRQAVAGQGGGRRGGSLLRTPKGQWPRCMKSFRNIRVIPVVLVAIFGLAVLKVAGLVIDGGYVFDYQPKPTKKSWAQENFNFPGGKRQAPRAIPPTSPARCTERRRRRRGRRRSRPRRRKRRSRTASWSIPSRIRSRCRRPSAPSWSGCRRGGRNWSSARAKSRFARAC